MRTSVQIAVSVWTLGHQGRAASSLRMMGLMILSRTFWLLVGCSNVERMIPRGSLRRGVGKTMFTRGPDGTVRQSYGPSLDVSGLNSWLLTGIASPARGA